MSHEPGIFQDIPEAEYHSGPELSVTAAKTILRCPAEYHWQRTHPVQKAAYDKGALVHRLILGAGDTFRVVDADSWRTKAAQEARDTARANGERPVLRRDLLEASKVAATARTNPDVADIFNRPGAAEMSLYATDPDTGVRLRGRADWLTESADAPCIVDVKTTDHDTHPWRIGKTISDFGYHQQAAWYLDLLAAQGEPDASFYFVFIPNSEPREPRVVHLPQSAIDRGRELNRRAIETFKRCSDAGEWPCNHPTFMEVDIPGYAYKDKELAS